MLINTGPVPRTGLVHVGHIAVAILAHDRSVAVAQLRDQGGASPDGPVGAALVRLAELVDLGLVARAQLPDRHAGIPGAGLEGAHAVQRAGLRDDRAGSRRTLGDDPGAIAVAVLRDVRTIVGAVVLPDHE